MIDVYLIYHSYFLFNIFKMSGFGGIGDAFGITSGKDKATTEQHKASLAALKATSDAGMNNLTTLATRNSDNALANQINASNAALAIQKKLSDNSNELAISLSNSAKAQSISRDRADVEQTQANSKMVSEMAKFNADAAEITGQQHTQQLNNTVLAITGANVAGMQALSTTASNAANAAAQVAIQQSANSTAALMNGQDAATKVSLAQMAKDTQNAILNADERTKAAAIAADTLRDLSATNAKVLSRSNDQLATTAANLAGIAGNVAMQANQTVAQIAGAALQANAFQNIENAKQQERMVSNAVNAQNQTILATLGPNGAQGLLGQQADFMQNVNAQYLRVISESQKALSAKVAIEAVYEQPSKDIVEQISKDQQIKTLQDMLDKSVSALNGLKQVADLQIAKPEYLNAPTSEIMTAIAASALVSSVQDCKSGSNNTMETVFSGTGNTIRNINLLQKNTFSAACMQSVEKTTEIQNNMINSVINVLSLQSADIGDSQGGADFNSLKQNVKQDIKNTFTSETIQNILNESNNKMITTFTGSNNIIENIVLQQLNEAVFNATQQEVQKISIISAVKQSSDSKLDQSKIKSVIAKQASGNLEESDNSTLWIIIGFIIFLMVVSIGYIAYNKYKARSLIGGYNNSYGEYNSQSTFGGYNNSYGEYKARSTFGGYDN